MKQQKLKTNNSTTIKTEWTKPNNNNKKNNPWKFRKHKKMKIIVEIEKISGK